MTPVEKAAARLAKRKAALQKAAAVAKKRKERLLRKAADQLPTDPLARAKLRIERRKQEKLK
jgi:hypothetical protein